MFRAFFHFHGNLNDFLPSKRQKIRFEHTVKEQGSIKDAIEALGVPHPEIDLILVNGCSVDFSYLLQAGDRVSVYPKAAAQPANAISKVRPLELSSYAFVLDVHLGKLARYLRFLGFDTLYRNDYDDAELAQISHEQQRVLLTQDLGLLKRSLVIYGYRVRSPQPKTQVKEILERFDLYAAIAPFYRCSRCNGRLLPVEKTAILPLVPHFTALHYQDFFQCQSCQQVYWQGAHYQKMQQLIAELSGLRAIT
ncbi:MAG: Mut7-C RNAse domain-containing protein [Phormidesmis sp.]